MHFVGIDNGVTGTLSVLDPNGICVLHCAMPVRKEQSYTKTKQNISRIDVGLLMRLLKPYCTTYSSRAYIERPMVNPGRFKATMSAMRALEATLIALEELQIPYVYIDSKEWQKKLLPEGCQKEELKRAATDIARRLFPSVTPKDADSLLIAYWAWKNR